MTRGIGTRLRQSSPGGGGLRFGGIWTVLIVMQVAVMAIVPTPVIAIYRGMGGGARAANAGLVPEQYLAVTMAMDAGGAWAAGSTSRHFRPATESSSEYSRPNPRHGITVASVLPLMIRRGVPST